MDHPTGNEARGRTGPASEAHPYRVDGAPQTLDRDLERGVRWYRRRIRRIFVVNLLILAIGLGAGAGVAQYHWAGWIGFGVLGLYLGVGVVISVAAMRSGAAFHDRLRRDPAMIEWVHIENEPVRPKLFSCEIRMRDGDTWPFVVSAKLAKILTEAAARWPFHVTRTREARAASLPWFEVEIGLRHLEDELTRAESSLARFLAPKLLAVLGRRSGPRMAPGGAARLKTALDRLAILLTAASKYDASGRRITKNASPAAVAIWSSVTQNPPYAEEANQLAQTICAVVESRREP